MSDAMVTVWSRIKDPLLVPAMEVDFVILVL